MYCFYVFVSNLTKHGSNAGGGGERVLWTAVALVQRTEPDVVSVIYSGDVDASKQEIIQKVKVHWSSLHPKHIPIQNSPCA